MRTKIGTGIAVVSLLFPWPGLAQPAGPPPPASRTVVVDCDAGESIGDALDQRADELRIEFTGTCFEDVVIRRDRTTLVGTAPGAEIVGTASPAVLQGGGVTVLGASGVTLADFTVRDGRRGVSVLEGAAARLLRIVARDHVRDGFLVIGGRAWLEELVSTGNGADGIAAWESSSVSLAPTGVVEASDNGRAGVLVSGSSDLTGFGTSSLTADDNFTGLHVQLGGSVQSVNLSADGNLLGIVLLVDGILGSPVDVRESGDVGVFVGDGSFASLAGPVEDSGGIGIWSEHDATLTFRGSVAGQPVGMRLDGTEARISDATVADPVELFFGTRVDFAGGNSFTGGVSCDGTVLVRGDVSCPPPAAEPAPAPAAAGADGAAGAAVPRVPLALEP